MTKAIIMLSLFGLMGISSWLMSRKARGILSRSLGREIRAGEETSLKAWMSVPDADLAAAPEQIRDNPAERVVDAMTVLRRDRHERSSEHLSIR